MITFSIDAASLFLGTLVGAFFAFLAMWIGDR